MPSEAVTLAHVARVEYLKELARLRAASLVDDLEPRDFLEEPTLTDRLAVDILDTVRPLVAQAEEEALEYASVLGLRPSQVAELEIVRDNAERAFVAMFAPELRRAAAPIGDALRAQLAAGLAPETIAAGLESETLRKGLLGPLTNAARNAGAAAVQDTVGDILDNAAEMMTTEAKAAGKPAPLFRWITVQDNRVCEAELEISCAPRHGMDATLAQWDQLGRPGSPGLLCQMVYRKRCRCHLEPAGNSKTPASPIVASSAIREGKERALAAWSREIR